MTTGYTAGSKRHQRQTNVSLVVNLIRQHAPINRAEIAERLGLDRSTITHITSRLIQEGCIRVHSEGGATSRGGRRPTMLALDATYGCSIGIDLTPGDCRAVVVDLEGAPLWRRGFSLGTSDGHDVEAVHSTIRQAVEAARRDGYRLLGAGLAVAGRVDSHTGTVLESRALDLTDYELMSHVAEWLDIPVLVDNDARCCAYGEIATHVDNRAAASTNGGSAQSSFLFLLGRYQVDGPGRDESGGLKESGIGIGVSVVIDGRIHTGDHFAAGEFYSTNWRVGSPGQIGIAPSRLVRIAEDREIRRTGFAEILSGLSPVASVIDPSELILGGEFRREHDLVESILRKELSSSFVGDGARVFSIRDSTNGDWETATGAAWMFLEHLFEVPTPEGRRRRNVPSWEDVFAQTGSATRERPR